MKGQKAGIPASGFAEDTTRSVIITEQLKRNQRPFWNIRLDFIWLEVNLVAHRMFFVAFQFVSISLISSGICAILTAWSPAPVKR